MKRIVPILIMVSALWGLLYATDGDIKDGLTAYENIYISLGLVDIQKIDSTIQVDLMYTSTDNFMGEDVYGELTKCYLRWEVAQMVKRANYYIKKKNPRYRLKMYDCVRPNSVQWSMWKIVKGTPKENYVVDPKYGSNHNYGAAVDVSIVRMADTGEFVDLDMGTPVDHLGILAEPRYERKFIKEGKLTEEQVKNRMLLRNAMRKSGFYIVLNEWWHFDAFSWKEIRRRYRIIR